MFVFITCRKEKKKTKEMGWDCEHYFFIFCETDIIWIVFSYFCFRCSLRSFWLTSILFSSLSKPRFRLSMRQLRKSLRNLHQKLREIRPRCVVFDFFNPIEFCERKQADEKIGPFGQTKQEIEYSFHSSEIRQKWTISERFPKIGQNEKNRRNFTSSHNPFLLSTNHRST